MGRVSGRGGWLQRSIMTIDVGKGRLREEPIQSCLEYPRARGQAGKSESHTAAMLLLPGSDVWLGFAVSFTFLP